MIVLLNGPLGIGKSTLAEALVESLERSVMLDGDKLIAANPEPPGGIDYLHSTIALLVQHHRRFGYRHFVIDHIWRTPSDLADLRHRVALVADDDEFRCFLLTLPEDEHLRRIERRARASTLDEREFELRTCAEERKALASFKTGELGEPFEVSDVPQKLVASLLGRLNLR